MQGEAHRDPAYVQGPELCATPLSATVASLVCF